MANFGMFTWSGRSEPMAPKPELTSRHKDLPAAASAWTVPPAGTGQGYSDPQEVVPGMTGRGIYRSPARQYGHRGTDVTARASAPVLGHWTSPQHSRDVMQAYSGMAHSDLRTADLYTHQYNPTAPREAGEYQGVDKAAGLPGPTMDAQHVIHDRPGGQFSAGASGQVGPVGFRQGFVRRWASRTYSSPALGAMYSRNTERGVLPQIVATPHNQPPLAGVMESGIASNTRFLGRTWTLPQLYTQPRSQSDVLMAMQPPPAMYTPTIGAGMI